MQNMLRKVLKNLLVDVVLLTVILSVAFFAESCERADAQENDMDVSNNVYEKCIAITFDDGPHGKDTEKLLDELKQLNVKASFFLIGENIEQSEMNRELVKRMYEEGHLIGNHTYSHVDIKKTGKRKVLSEIYKTNDIIEDITGGSVAYIRPPYGSYEESFLDCISMTPVLWTIDPDDWDTTNVSLVVERVVKNASDRGIILLHDCYESSVAAAVEIIERLQKEGYHFVTVDQVMLE